jgi:Cu-Zn family superoxide dismutase
VGLPRGILAGASRTLTSSLLVLSAGCVSVGVQADYHVHAPGATRAVSVLHPTEGHTVSGTVTFERVNGSVYVSAEVHGLTPGEHGFHIHEHGDCSKPDATSAGGHYDPAGKPHGGPDAKKRHLGDLGNLVADADGTAIHTRTDSVIRLDGRNSIVGRAVIVHAGADDLTTQPTGGAGARVACGVIGIAEDASP